MRRSSSSACPIAIAEVAASIEPGPWIAHVSGGTPLAALEPHARRFSVHPLQTFTHARGAEQLDGAWAAVTGETDEAVEVATELAELLGLRPFALADDRRSLYHAALRSRRTTSSRCGAPPASSSPRRTRRRRPSTRSCGG